MPPHVARPSTTGTSATARVHGSACHTSANDSSQGSSHNKLHTSPNMPWGNSIQAHHLGCKCLCCGCSQPSLAAMGTAQPAGHVQPPNYPWPASGSSMLAMVHCGVALMAFEAWPLIGCTHGYLSVGALYVGAHAQQAHDSCDISLRTSPELASGGESDHPTTTCTATGSAATVQPQCSHSAATVLLIILCPI